VAYAITSVRVAASEFRDVAAVYRVASVNPSTHGGRVASLVANFNHPERPRRCLSSQVDTSPCTSCRSACGSQCRS